MGTTAIKHVWFKFVANPTITSFYLYCTDSLHAGYPRTTIVRSSGLYTSTDAPCSCSLCRNSINAYSADEVASGGWTYHLYPFTAFVDSSAPIQGETGRKVNELWMPNPRRPAASQIGLLQTTRSSMLNGRGESRGDGRRIGKRDLYSIETHVDMKN